MGINRLNIYAGLQGFCIVRDEHEAALDLPAANTKFRSWSAIAFSRPMASSNTPSQNFLIAPGFPRSSATPSSSTASCCRTLKSSRANIALRIMNGSNGRFYRFSFSN
jgi:spore coat protein A